MEKSLCPQIIYKNTAIYYKFTVKKYLVCSGCDAISSTAWTWDQSTYVTDGRCPSSLGRDRRRQRWPAIQLCERNLGWLALARVAPTQTVHQRQNNMIGTSQGRANSDSKPTSEQHLKYRRISPIRQRVNKCSVWMHQCHLKTMLVHWYSMYSHSATECKEDDDRVKHHFMMKADGTR